MAFHPHKLLVYYNEVVVSGRREADAIFDFMHHDERARGRREAWIASLENLVLADQPEFYELPGIAEQIHWITHDAPPNMQDAFFWICVWLFPQVRQYLETVRTANRLSMMTFVNHPEYLGKLCTDMLSGNVSNPDINAFVRAVRIEYVATVGVEVEFETDTHLSLTT